MKTDTDDKKSSVGFYGGGVELQLLSISDAKAIHTALEDDNIDGHDSEMVDYTILNALNGKWPEGWKCEPLPVALKKWKKTQEIKAIHDRLHDLRIKWVNKVVRLNKIKDFYCRYQTSIIMVRYKDNNGELHEEELDKLSWGKLLE